MHAYRMFLFLCKDQAISFLSDHFPNLTHTSASWKDKWRQKAAQHHCCGLTHQGTSQQLMAPRTLAGKQGDFKVSNALQPEQVTAYTSEGCQQGWVGGMTNPSSRCNPHRTQHLCTSSRSRVGRHRAMHPALLHAVVSRGSHLQRWAGFLSHQDLIWKSCTAVHQENPVFILTHHWSFMSWI